MIIRKVFYNPEGEDALETITPHLKNWSELSLDCVEFGRQHEGVANSAIQVRLNSGFQCSPSIKWKWKIVPKS